MAGFIDFVAACAKDSTLGKEFITVIKDKSEKDLSSWFESKGFTVSVEDAAKLTATKNEISDIKATATRSSY